MVANVVAVAGVAVAPSIGSFGSAGTGTTGMLGFIDTSSVFSLVVGAFVLGLIAVVLDRINFPQRPFRAKRIRTGSGGPRRDRTGAHIVDVVDADDES